MSGPGKTDTSNGLALAAMIVAGCAAAGALVPFAGKWLGLVGGAVGLCLGLLALRQAGGVVADRQMALGAIALSLVAVVAAFLGRFLYASIF